MSAKNKKAAHNGPFGKFDPDNPAHAEWLKELSDSWSEGMDIKSLAKQVLESAGIKEEDSALDEATAAELEKIIKSKKF